MGKEPVSRASRRPRIDPLLKVTERVSQAGRAARRERRAGLRRLRLRARAAQAHPREQPLPPLARARLPAQSSERIFLPLEKSLSLSRERVTTLHSEDKRGSMRSLRNSKAKRERERPRACVLSRCRARSLHPAPPEALADVRFRRVPTHIMFMSDSRALRDAPRTPPQTYNRWWYRPPSG